MRFVWLSLISIVLVKDSQIPAYSNKLRRFRKKQSLLEPIKDRLWGSTSLFGWEVVVSSLFFQLCYSLISVSIYCFININLLIVGYDSDGSGVDLNNWWCSYSVVVYCYYSLVEYQFDLIWFVSVSPICHTIWICISVISCICRSEILVHLAYWFLFWSYLVVLFD